jgi:dihydrofolate reductase
VGRLIYSMSMSLDGFVDTPSRSLDWVHVDEELHGVFNDQARGVGTFVYGRRMYELMAGYWPTGERDPDATPATADFARIWRDKPKLVVSETLGAVEWNSRLVRRDAAIEAVRRLKDEGPDLDIGGPTTAAPFLAAGLVDEVTVYVEPVVLGAGTRFFPALDERIELRLADTRTFASGVVMLRYETVAGRG